MEKQLQDRLNQKGTWERRVEDDTSTRDANGNVMVYNPRTGKYVPGTEDNVQQYAMFKEDTNNNYLEKQFNIAPKFSYQR